MRQRTDSTHVLGRIRDLNRLELAGETVRAALEALAAAAPGWEWALCRVTAGWMPCDCPTAQANQMGHLCVHRCADRCPSIWCQPKHAGRHRGSGHRDASGIALMLAGNRVA